MAQSLVYGLVSDRAAIQGAPSTAGPGSLANSAFCALPRTWRLLGKKLSTQFLMPVWRRSSCWRYSLLPWRWGRSLTGFRPSLLACLPIDAESASTLLGLEEGDLGLRSVDASGARALREALWRQKAKAMVVRMIPAMAAPRPIPTTPAVGMELPSSPGSAQSAVVDVESSGGLSARVILVAGRSIDASGTVTVESASVMFNPGRVMVEAGRIMDQSLYVTVKADLENSTDDRGMGVEPLMIQRWLERR